MVHTRIVACAMVLFLLALAKPALSQTEAQSDKGHSGPHFDTEHIFGFGEGSDIGAQGEWEIESFTIGSFGAAGRDFNIANDTSIRYTITDELRFSVGTLTDYLNIHDPRLSIRNGANLSGIVAEIRWNILNRLTSPFGMTFTFDPEWRRTDPGFGRYNDNAAITAALLIDKEVIPNQLFMELNLAYAPLWRPLAGQWLRDDSFTVLVGGSYVITPNFLVGAEIRHENFAPYGFPRSHALFVGPHVFLQLDKSLTASFAWAFQVPDFGARHADLVNFERYEAGLRLVYGF